MLFAVNRRTNHETPTLFLVPLEMCLEIYFGDVYTGMNTKLIIKLKIRRTKKKRLFFSLFVDKECNWIDWMSRCVNTVVWHRLGNWYGFFHCIPLFPSIFRDEYDKMNRRPEKLHFLYKYTTDRINAVDDSRVQCVLIYIWPEKERFGSLRLKTYIHTTC